MTKKDEKNDEILLSKDEIWNVLSFARALSGEYGNLLTPDLVHRRMQDISFQPRSATSTQLDEALANPKDSEDSLRSFVESFEILSMPFKRILSYMSSLLSLDITYSVKNIEHPNEYDKPAFKKDQAKLYEFLDRFDHQGGFRNVIKQLLRNEIYVCSVRQDGKNVVLQELPLDFCKITGRWDYGLLVSFNFYYFLQPGIDINLYPRFFKQKYVELFGEGSDITSYNPALSVGSRGNSQYVYWVDLPPDVGWAFKLDTSLITAIPYFAGLMPDLVNQGVMRALQKDMNMASASKMLLGQVPMLKDTKANVKDMIAVDPVTLGKFLSLVKASMSSAIKVASAPLEDMQAISFETDNELYDKYLRTALASSGMNTALIYSSQVKANVIDSQLSFEADSKIMEQTLYPQFNAFMNYWANKELKKYQYIFEFEGNDFYLSRAQRFEQAMTLADKGIVLPQKIAASIGIKPQTLYRWIEEAKETKFVDNLTPIISAFQMSGGGEKPAGRPAKSDSGLDDSGAQTKGAGSNVGKKATPK
jgi:hypothetical protein